MLISQAAASLIIEQEVSSEAIYRKKYTSPTWPEGESGVTVGIGYDCGYSTEDQIEADWAGKIPDQMVAQLMTVAGLQGGAAAHAVHSVQSVVVPWEAAIDEFENVEVPKWLAKVRKVFPNTEKLPPDCLGSIVSLAYNRGLALEGARRIEMLNIRNLLRDGHPEKVPAQFRSMKRLWTNGLVHRREVEAQLFEKGLASLRG